MKRKLTALFLACIMVMQVSGLSVLAQQDGENSAPEEEAAAGCVFNFSAAKYVMSESDESYEISVERQGNADAPAEVVFKAIDTLAVYGEDYTVLDEDGNPLEKAAGTVLAPQQLERLAATQKREVTESEEREGNSECGDIFEARNVMLGIDQENTDAEEKEIKTEIQNAVETVSNALFEAEGVSGMLHFDAGETQKSFTVIPIDNMIGSSDKTVILALLGRSAGEIAPNATASMVIMDDEPYELPVFEIAESRMTLDASNPQAELTIRRVSGEEYYSTVLVSTYCMTAQGGVDFAPLNDHQIVFAPGETEHTVTVEALNFSYSGSFGVRIVGDDSSKIGENDRTVVHINGEKSEPRETEPEDTTPTATLFAARANTVSLASAEDETWDGVLGSKFYRVKDLNMWLSSVGYDWTYQIRTEDRRTIKLGEEVIVDTGGSESLKINLDLGTANANIENISLDIKTKQVFGYDISNADRSMKGSWEHSYQYNINAPVSQDWESRTFDIGKFPSSSSSSYRYTYVIEPAFWFPGDMKVAVEGCTYEFKDKYAVKTMEAQKVKTVSYFNLNTTGGSGDEYAVNYQPPSLKLQTNDGKNIDAFYPTDEMINIVCDENEAALHGMNLNGVVVSNRELSDSELSYIKSGSKRSYAAYLTRDEFKISGADLIKKVTDAAKTYYFYPDFCTVYTRVKLESADDGETIIHSQKGDYFYTKTGSVIEGKGYAGANKVITGYAVYGHNQHLGMASPRTLISVYRHPEDSSLLGGEGSLFFVPFVPPEFTNVYIVPLTEFQGLTIKPHPSTKTKPYMKQ